MNEINMQVTVPSAATIGPVPIVSYDNSYIISNWGDGTTDTELTHTYSSGGTYDIYFSNIIANFKFGSNSNWGQQYIVWWSTNGVINDLSYAFYNATALITVNLNPAVCTNMSHMFHGATSFNDLSGSIVSWDTSVVTDMSNMFYGATAFNQDISIWDTKNVTDMSNMFYGATAFNQNIGSWNITKLTNAANMLDNTAINITNYDALLNGWDAQTVKPNVIFGASNLQCSPAGRTSRSSLITRTWTINDNGITCFVAGTRILTPKGYVAVETLTTGDYVCTADLRTVPIKHHCFHVFNATTQTAPYRISANALGLELPYRDIALSGPHAVRDANCVWKKVFQIAKTNPLVKQYGIGETIVYYHIECPNYYTDDLLSEGLLVESFNTTADPLFMYESDINGYIRIYPPRL